MYVRSKIITKERIGNILVLVIISFFLGICYFLNSISNCNTYSFFLEFYDAHGIQRGTPVKLRGFEIGYVLDISYEVNTILALVKVESTSHLIPVNSLIESNQTGILNEAVIDILPISHLDMSNKNLLNPHSSSCRNSEIICQSSVLQADRGLNYDDLVRATTRITQRFDDPRFFQLLYVFFQNSIEVSDYVVDISSEISDLVLLMYKKIQKYI